MSPKNFKKSTWVAVLLIVLFLITYLLFIKIIFGLFESLWDYSFVGFTILILTFYVNLKIFRWLKLGLFLVLTKNDRIENKDISEPKLKVFTFGEGKNKIVIVCHTSLIQIDTLETNQDFLGDIGKKYPQRRIYNIEYDSIVDIDYDLQTSEVLKVGLFTDIISEGIGFYMDFNDFQEFIEIIGNNSDRIKINRLRRNSIDYVHHIRQQIPNVDIREYNKSIWFEGSWGTIEESLSKNGGEGYHINERTKEVIKNTVFQRINQFPSSVNDVDDWYKKVLTEISDDGLITIGRVQKVLNVLIKYHITKSFFIEDERINTNLLFEDTMKQIHVPIDNHLLEYLLECHRESFQDIINSNKKLYNNDIETTWSSLNDMDLYMEFQQRIRELSNSLHYICPLDFEMDKLKDD